MPFQRKKVVFTRALGGRWEVISPNHSQKTETGLEIGGHRSRDRWSSVSEKPRPMTFSRLRYVSVNTYLAETDDHRLGLGLGFPNFIISCACLLVQIPSPRRPPRPSPGRTLRHSFGPVTDETIEGALIRGVAQPRCGAVR